MLCVQVSFGGMNVDMCAPIGELYASPSLMNQHSQLQLLKSDEETPPTIMMPNTAHEVTVLHRPSFVLIFVRTSRPGPIYLSAHSVPVPTTHIDPHFKLKEFSAVVGPASGIFNCLLFSFQSILDRCVS